MEAHLIQDDDYLLEQVLSAMAYLFVDFTGYILYKGFGAEVHDLGKCVLARGSLASLAKTADFVQVSAAVREEDVDGADALALSWHAFRHTLSQLLAGPWRQSYLTARNRTRFNYQSSTRQKIFEQLDALDKFMSKSQLTQPWAVGIPAKTGIYAHFKKVITQA